jgi:hypothetical protein
MPPPLAPGQVQRATASFMAVYTATLNVDFAMFANETFRVDFETTYRGQTAKKAAVSIDNVEIASITPGSVNVETRIIFSGPTTEATKGIVEFGALASTAGGDIYLEEPYFETMAPIYIYNFDVAVLPPEGAPAVAMSPPPWYDTTTPAWGEDVLDGLGIAPSLPDDVADSTIGRLFPDLSPTEMMGMGFGFMVVVIGCCVTCIVATRRLSRFMQYEAYKRRSVAEWHRQRALAAMHANIGRPTDWSPLNPLLPPGYNPVFDQGLADRARPKRQRRPPPVMGKKRSRPAARLQRAADKEEEVDLEAGLARRRAEGRGNFRSRLSLSSRGSGSLSNRVVPDTAEMQQRAERVAARGLSSREDRADVDEIALQMEEDASPFTTQPMLPPPKQAKRPPQLSQQEKKRPRRRDGAASSRDGAGGDGGQQPPRDRGGRHRDNNAAGAALAALDAAADGAADHVVVDVLPEQHQQPQRAGPNWQPPVLPKPKLPRGVAPPPVGPPAPAPASLDPDRGEEQQHGALSRPRREKKAARASAVPPVGPAPARAGPRAPTPDGSMRRPGRRPRSEAAEAAAEGPPQGPSVRPVVGRTPLPFEGWDQQSKLKKWRGGIKGQGPPAGPSRKPPTDEDATNRV